MDKQPSQSLSSLKINREKKTYRAVFVMPESMGLQLAEIHNTLPHATISATIRTLLSEAIEARKQAAK